MKIGIVAPGGFDRTGRERIIPVLLWLVERLARRHEVHVYTLYQYPDPDDFQLAGASIHNIGGGRGLASGLGIIKRTVSAITREHRRSPFHVLHGLWAGVTGLASNLAARRLGIPSVVTVLGGELFALPEIGYGGQLAAKSRFAISLALKYAAAVTSQSTYNVELLEKRGISPEVIPLGIDTRVFEPPDTPPIGPPWRLISVGSLNRVKDYPTSLRAFAEIRRHEPQASLSIVGEDTLNGEIQSLSRDLRLDGAVCFHGFQYNDTVAEMLRGSHLFLHSSRHESGPVSLLEAGGSAVPAVGTAVGHFWELCPEYVTAAPVGDHKALADAAIELIRDENRRRAMGEKLLGWARSHDADWTAKRFEELYLELIATRKT